MFFTLSQLLIYLGPKSRSCLLLLPPRSILLPRSCLHSPQSMSAAHRQDQGQDQDQGPPAEPQGSPCRELLWLHTLHQPIPQTQPAFQGQLLLCFDIFTFLSKSANTSGLQDCCWSGNTPATTAFSDLGERPLQLLATESISTTQEQPSSPSTRVGSKPGLRSPWLCAAAPLKSLLCLLSLFHHKELTICCRFMCFQLNAVRSSISYFRWQPMQLSQISPWALQCWHRGQLIFHLSTEPKYTLHGAKSTVCPQLNIKLKNDQRKWWTDSSIFSWLPNRHKNHSKPGFFLAFSFIQDGREAPLPRRCSVLLSAWRYRSGFLVRCLSIIQMKTLNKLRISVPWSCH